MVTISPLGIKQLLNHDPEGATLFYTHFKKSCSTPGNYYLKNFKYSDLIKYCFLLRRHWVPN